MVGLCVVVRKSHILWWCQVQIPDLCNQKEYRWFWKSGACGQEVVCISSVQKTCAFQKQPLAVLLASCNCSQIFLNKGHLFKRPSRMLATCASFFQNFIVSWTLSNFSGVHSKDISASTVIIHMMGWEQTSLMLLPQLTYQLFGSGSTVWFGKWMHTEVEKMPRKLR